MPSPEKHVEFVTPFLWASLLFGCIGGFGLAANLALAIGFGFQSGSSISSVIQVHAQLQLFGWVGLLLMGISLYVIPRIASSQSPSRERQLRVLLFVATGIAMRSLAQIALPHLADNILLSQICRIVLVFGAGCLTIGILMYIRAILSGCQKQSPEYLQSDETRKMKPYFALMFFGWTISAALQLVIVLMAVFNQREILDPEFHSFLSDLFISLIIIPATMAFSTRMLPIFLGLRAPRWPVREVGVLYAITTLSIFLFQSFSQLGFYREITKIGTEISLIMRGLVMLWFVWELDILARRVLPERVVLKQFRSDAATIRGRYADRGEFGCFELFIYTAYTWFIAAAFVEILNGIITLSGHNQLVEGAVLRHMYLLGFTSHLIVGVGFRLIPGLLRSRLWSTRFVTVSFVSLFTAAIFRMGPLIIPSIGVLGPKLFGVSGLLGLAAVSLFAVDIFITSRQSSRGAVEDRKL